MPRRQQSPKLLAINRIKVMVKVTRSLTLMSFKRVSLVEYARQISYASKVMAKVIFLPQSHRQTDRQTGQKLDAPNSIRGGGGIIPVT